MQKENKYSLTRNDIHENGIKAHLEHINREFSDGFEFLKKFPKSVTIFGSSQAKPEEEHYKMATELAGHIVSDLKYAVITGGGPGIMEAANKGAYDAGGPSVGLNISLPHEWNTNAYCTHALKFSYFFARKTMLTFAAEAFIFFPGGFGTMDELFSILTLIQTEKIPHVPIILFDSKYWYPFQEFIKKDLLERFGTVEKEDMKLFEITDSVERAIEIIHKAPLSEWWRNIN
ncbi:MAG: TIGR00730 family Rossman fold protein [Patescibacteria group bacterium]|nr:TIGR00730 family Rossman fold protein [Patescibacteria group bacterium]